MNAQLHRRLLALENETGIMLDKASGLHADAFNRRTNGEWSVGQILNHLIASERLSLEYMKKSLSG